MKLTFMTICASALIIGAKAFAGNPLAGTDDPHVTPPQQVENCETLYRRYPSKPTRLQAFMWNNAFPMCHWEGERRKPVRKPTPRPEPKPEKCLKRIEDQGGAVIYVECGHKLTEGQSE